jgi:hypothetical protein
VSKRLAIGSQASRSRTAAAAPPYLSGRCSIQSISHQIPGRSDRSPQRVASASVQQPGPTRERYQLLPDYRDLGGCKYSSAIVIEFPSNDPADRGRFYKVDLFERGNVTPHGDYVPQSGITNVRPRTKPPVLHRFRRAISGAAGGARQGWREYTARWLRAPPSTDAATPQTGSSEPYQHLLANPETFDDGEALFAAVCERELERIIAKRLDSRYIPGYRGWTKIKNRSYWRYELERESAINRPRQRMFV